MNMGRGELEINALLSDDAFECLGHFIVHALKFWLKSTLLEDG
jgi:hypothetical protein